MHHKLIAARMDCCSPLNFFLRHLVNVGIILAIINILVHIQCFVCAIVSSMSRFTQFAAELLTLPTGEQDLLGRVDLAERFVAAAARDIMLMVVMVFTMSLLCTQVRPLQIDPSLE